MSLVRKVLNQSLHMIKESKSNPKCIRKYNAMLSKVILNPAPTARLFLNSIQILLFDFFVDEAENVFHDDKEVCILFTICFLHAQFF